MVAKRKTFDEQFWPKIDPDTNGGCWLWNAAIFPSTGYAAIQHRGRSICAHRVGYEALVGPVPDGLELDHKCRVRSCVNPDHLEPVTHVENLRRSPIHVGSRSECPAGHPYSAENTKITKAGERVCRTCRLKRQRSPEQRAKQAAYREANREKNIAYQRAGRAG